MKKEKTAEFAIANESFAKTMVITIGSRTYFVNGFFKSTGKTVSEKLYNIMEKEVENADSTRYNDFIPQESLAVGNLRRIEL